MAVRNPNYAAPPTGELSPAKPYGEDTDPVVAHVDAVLTSYPLRSLVRARCPCCHSTYRVIERPDRRMAYRCGCGRVMTVSRGDSA